MHILLSVVFAAALLATQQIIVQRPDFAGLWRLDSFLGRGPLGSHARPICELPGRSTVAAPVVLTARPSPADEQLAPMGTVEGELTITQSSAEITIDRRYRGSMPEGRHRSVVALDGSEHVETAGGITAHTRGRWEGGALVIEHRLRWTRAGRQEGCSVTERLTLEDGMLHVTVTNDKEGTRSRQQYARARTARR